MSKLDSLIAKLCPDGVVYKALGECCKLSAGGDVPKESFSKEQSEKYTVPIYSNGIGENALYGWTENARIKEPCVTIAARGTIGYSALREKPFVPIIRLICVIPNSDLNVKYLKYAVEILTFQVPTSGIPQLTIPMISKYKIPLSPLPVQHEIVRILDNFTKLTAELVMELEAELVARKKQHDYYKDLLLAFGDDVPVLKLSYCCISISDGDHQAPPKTDSGIPFITISNITNANTIDFSNTKFVPETYYIKLDDKRKAQKNDILYTVVGSFGIPVLIENDIKFTFQRHIAILRPNNEIIISKYLYHVLQGSYFMNQANIAAVGAAQKTITLSALNNMKVPLPPLDEQARIVEILDRFDALTTDISNRLPAEIVARQKQYEYYRDTLLKFEKIN